jgi:adenylate cyclase
MARSQFHPGYGDGVSNAFLASIAGNRRELLSVLAISSAVGAAAGLVVTGGTTRGLLQGALSGALILLFVRIAGMTRARLGVRAWPFGASVMVGALVTAAAICGGLAAASVPWLFSEGLGGWRTYVIPFATAVVASIAFTWWFALDRLLGGGVLVGLLTGRYHRPRREERIFLFADLRHSTALAERLGELTYHSFLNRAFVDAAQPVDRHDGLIHKYVGDQMVVTWPLERGLRDWGCVRCALEIGEVLAETTDEYEREFGATPHFRFAVHCGPVVAGEMGDLRREIVFSGDTLNTAARIEAVAKETGRDVVVSEDVLRHAPTPPDLSSESLGVHRLPGKERPLELFAVARRSGGADRPSTESQLL